MTALQLSLGEPFASPAWGANFAVFVSDEPVPEDASQDYLRRACKYARTHTVYLVPERFMLLGYQCLCLISPQGKVMGAQKALHLNTDTRVGKRAGSIEVLRTEFGGLFLCVDVDVYHPEVLRIAADMGAQHVICSQHVNGGDYSSNMVFTGAWNAAQLSNVYVIDACNEFCCVCAPLALTRHGDGFIAPPSRKMPLTAKLDPEILRELALPYRLGRRFYAVHREDLLR